MKSIKKRAFFHKEMLNRVMFFLILFMLLIYAVDFMGQGTRVTGRSMENTFMEGDSLFINKLSYRFVKPKRFDIVVFPLEEEGDTIFCIKRVIGLPGETIQIAGDMIYIDGKILRDDYGKEAMEEGSAGIAASPLTLSEDEYFVLGDNRNYSADSRQPQIGPVKEGEIIGKAAFRFWPWR